MLNDISVQISWEDRNKNAVLTRYIHVFKMQMGKELKNHWTRVFSHGQTWWLKMWTKQAKKIPTPTSNVSKSFALEGNKFPNHIISFQA